MKHKKIIKAFDSIQPDDFAKARVLGKVHQKTKKTHRRLLPAIGVAAAIMLFTLLFGNTLRSPKEPDLFSLEVYAMDSGGANAPNFTAANTSALYFDKGALNLEMGFEFEADTVESITLKTQDGYFAKQYFVRNPTDADYTSPSQITVFYDDGLLPCMIFEEGRTEYGSTMSIDKALLTELLTEDVLLYFVLDRSTISSEMVAITAYVTLNNGQVLEQILEINLNQVLPRFDSVMEDFINRNNIKYINMIDFLELYERTLHADIDTAKLEQDIILWLKEKGFKEVRITGLDFENAPERGFLHGDVYFDAIPGDDMAENWVIEEPDESGWVSNIFIFASAFNQEFEPVTGKMYHPPYVLEGEYFDIQVHENLQSAYTYSYHPDDSNPFGVVEVREYQRDIQTLFAGFLDNDPAIEAYEITALSPYGQSSYPDRQHFCVTYDVKPAAGYFDKVLAESAVIRPGTANQSTGFITGRSQVLTVILSTGECYTSGMEGPR